MADADRLAAALRYQQDMEGPVTMNPNIAEQGRKGRANMAPPTSVMDPRSRDYERRSRETENFLIGADILAGALPFAPLAKGAAMAAGRYATPKVMQGMENYMGRTGMTLNAAPQEEALRLAQQRAALPVKKGGLGLPADNTPQQRAAAMGFNTDVYHATMNDFPKFDLGKAGEGTTITKAEKAVFSSNNPSVANEFVAGPYYNNNGIVDRFYPSRSNVMPLKIRSDSASLWDMYGRGYDADFVKQAIKDARKSKDDTVVFNKMRDPGFTTVGQGELSSIVGSLIPDNIRSRFAAFDPFRRNAALAAALGVAAPDLLAEEK